MSMQNLIFPEAWEKAKSQAITGYVYGTPVGSFDEAARIMAESYEKRIAELEKQKDTVIGYQLQCNLTLSSKQVECDKLKARIAELEKEVRDPYPDTEANGWAFCGKCGHQK